MNRCATCLYPNTKPDLHFDEEGVCSACTAYDKRKLINWAARERELLKILEEAPKNGSGYDLIVPSSGGKDSHYQVLKLIELGARPLVVTATTCHLTPIGRKNIDNLARYATTIEVTPNRTVRASLNRLGLELVGDISWPEHVSIFTTPFRVACDLGIPLIFYGECPQEAYGGPPGTEEAREMTLRWTQEFGGFLGLRPSDMVGHRGILAEEMQDYKLPSAKRIKALGVRAYFLGQFYEWDSWRNAEVARKHGMLWQLPSVSSLWEFENLDNAQTGLHDYLMFLKYGYGRATAQFSVGIRAGHYEQYKNGIRDEGDLDLDADDCLELDRLYPDAYMGIPIADILRPLGLSQAEFDAIAAQHSILRAA